MTDPQSPSSTLSGVPIAPLREFDAPPPDPLVLLGEWLSAAESHGVREPLALTLATVGEDRRPSSRVVLVKDLDDRGFVFSSHHGSRKGRQIADIPWAAGNLYWRETLQQVSVAGPVERLDDAMSDELFSRRPIGAQATTVASRQSEPLEDEAALRAAAEELAGAGGPLERPDGWGGYRLVIEEIEFWHGSADRLHRRLQYRREGGAWTPRRLQP